MSPCDQPVAAATQIKQRARHSPKAGPLIDAQKLGDAVARGCGRQFRHDGAQRRTDLRRPLPPQKQGLHNAQRCDTCVNKTRQRRGHKWIRRSYKARRQYQPRRTLPFGSRDAHRHRPGKRLAQNDKAALRQPLANQRDKFIVTEAFRQRIGHHLHAALSAQANRERLQQSAGSIKPRQ